MMPFCAFNPVNLLLLHIGGDLLPGNIILVVLNPVIVQRAREIIRDPHERHIEDLVVRAKAVVVVEHRDPITDVAMGLFPGEHGNQVASFGKEGLGLLMELDGEHVCLVG